MSFWLTFTLFLHSASLVAESGAYRVEILVFRHLDSAIMPVEVEALRTFAEAFRLDHEGAALIPEDPVALDVISEQMESVWRRLGLGAGYQPLVFVVWEQSRIDYHPAVRIHDQEIIAQRLRFPGNLAYVDLRSADMFSDYVASFFRLDGTIQLRRSRFLHLDLNLEYREELIQAGAPLPQSVEAALIQAELENSLPESPLIPARIHPLTQSRQIRTGSLQYFDTPYLGVLARITATAGE